MRKKLSKRDAEIVRRYFKAGETMEEIGNALGISRQRVGVILKKPEATTELERMKTTSKELAHARLMMNADKAADVMIRLMDSKNENQKYLAALDVMNRVNVQEQKVDERVEIVFVDGTVKLGEEQDADQAIVQADSEAENVS